MNLLKFMLKSSEYMQDYLVRMTHHSTAIEGNTLTQEQTASILLSGVITGNVLEREFYEVKNYKRVMPFILQSIQEDQKLTPMLIKEIHALTMENLLPNAGSFKTIQNLIVGADFETTKPYLVPTRIYELCDNLDHQLQNAKSDDEKLKIILKTHFDFERIHPFSDGNGRTGRLLIFYSCLQENILPPIIQKEDKNLYIAILREEKLDDFFALAKQIQAKEQERMEVFKQNMKQNTQRLSPQKRLELEKQNGRGR